MEGRYIRLCTNGYSGKQRHSSFPVFNIYLIIFTRKIRPPRVLILNSNLANCAMQVADRVKELCAHPSDIATITGGAALYESRAVL